MNHSWEEKTAVVPTRGRQDGEATAQVARDWSWVEPAVWNVRMLKALETGVKGGKWFSLIDKVYSDKNLRSAFAQVKANRGAAGIDHQTVEMFEARLEENLERLQARLREGSYRPQGVRRVWIPKPGQRKAQRPLGIPTVCDRVAQTALRNVLEPIFEKDFAAHSYGFRPGRGCKDALRVVSSLLKTGHHFVVDADLRSYFDTIPHEPMLQRVSDKVSDGRILDLLAHYLRAEIFDGMHHWRPTSGSPQGAVISPLLSNIYLDPLDHLMAREGYNMVRYADDFVILCRTAEEAQRALHRIQEWTEANGLQLHPDKTMIVDTREKSFDFLGYSFGPPYGKWPRKKSLDRLKATIRQKTRRANGHSLAQIIKMVNRTLRGWFEYFKHAKWYIFAQLDRWIRRRLRTILRRRAHKRGISRGSDHWTWPNAYFTEHGLFSLMAAHRSALQSVKR